MGDPSRTLGGNSRKRSESVSGVFPEFLPESPSRTGGCGPTIDYTRFFSCSPQKLHVDTLTLPLLSSANALKFMTLKHPWTNTSVGGNFRKTFRTIDPYEFPQEKVWTNDWSI